MQRRTMAVALLVVLFAVSMMTTRKTDAASDWIAAYARIDKVVFEPNSNAPERVQIWGVFSLANGNRGSQYDAPRRGYVYYSILNDKADLCRKEWADFKSAAGTDTIIAFGSRNNGVGHLRKVDDKPSNPDPYPLASGLGKFTRNNAADYPPVRDLRAFPREPK